jgi:hypothetical protein
LLVCEEIVKEEELRNIMVNVKQSSALKIWKIIDRIWRRKLKEKIQTRPPQEGPRRTLSFFFTGFCILL